MFLHRSVAAFDAGAAGLTPKRTVDVRKLNANPLCGGEAGLRSIACFSLYAILYAMPLHPVIDSVMMPIVNRSADLRLVIVTILGVREITSVVRVVKHDINFAA